MDLSKVLQNSSDPEHQHAAPIIPADIDLRRGMHFQQANFTGNMFMGKKWFLVAGMYLDG